jgi:transposase
MSLIPRMNQEIPANTVRVARSSFPKGNVYMILRDRLGDLYRDEGFRELFSWKGQEAYPPGMLALVIVMQFMEGLSDRQAAEAVRARIDWKYALGLELDDDGFDASLLTTFRQRLLAGGTEALLLNRILEIAIAHGMLKPRGKMRTDATHVMAAVRDLNRLELVGEALRYALNTIANINPEWLLAQITPDWFDRYSAQIEQTRLPKEEAKRRALRLTIGADGYHLLSALYQDEGTRILWAHAAIEALRQIWIQNYYQQAGVVHWRGANELPTGALIIQSPYDIEARYSQKRQTEWKGYKAHLTESCEPDLPHLLVHVETTPASTSDKGMIPRIHQALADKQLLPAEHLLDGGYLSVKDLVESQTAHQVTVVGPLPPDTSWQTQEESGLGIACFAIDWEAQQVTCPQGHTSRIWSSSLDKQGHESITVRFAKADCLACPLRTQCTRSPDAPRALTLQPEPYHHALLQARQHQETDDFAEQYSLRAGIEGAISVNIRAHDLRNARYIGLAKSHLQNVAIAAARNLISLGRWFLQEDRKVPIPDRRATTRTTRFAAINPALC